VNASGLSLGQWYQFAFPASGGAAISCVSAAQRCLIVPDTIQAGPPQWTLGGPLSFDVILTVTDPFLPVDLFEIVSNGRPVAPPGPALAASTAIEPVGTVCDPRQLLTCVGDPSRHSVTTTFAAGETIAFEIWVTAARSSRGGSGFFLLTAAPDVNATVPEPATWLLVGSGLVLAAWTRRRKASATA
jgi:hypothetical protein